VRRDASITVVVEDNGRGFDTHAVSSDSLGLDGMRERVELHEGRLTVETASGSGTTIRIEVPL
jgi:signal transduction histidine kinase